jgi:hypothetical protein
MFLSFSFRRMLIDRTPGILKAWLRAEGPKPDEKIVLLLAARMDCLRTVLPTLK